MFDLIAHGHQQSPHGDTAPMMMSFGAHAFLISLVAIVPLLYVGAVPEVPGMMAFVAAPPPPPPPPPPPSPPPPPEARPPEPQPAAPEAPVIPELEYLVEEAPPPDPATQYAEKFGIARGVPGGVPGGIVSAVATLDPAPPPAPVAPQQPVRIGGAITQPELLSRVAPVYPPVAEQSRVGGLVVLEAVVGPDGLVDDVTVLRSVPLLDRAAIDAVRQWRYSPLVLDGRAVPFIVTVTVRFDAPR